MFSTILQSEEQFPQSKDPTFPFLQEVLFLFRDLHIHPIQVLYLCKGILIHSRDLGLPFNREPTIHLGLLFLHKELTIPPREV